MHVRVRIGGVGESPIVVVPSRLTKIKQFRSILYDKFQIAPELQRLFYGGKLVSILICIIYIFIQIYDLLFYIL